MMRKRNELQSIFDLRVAFLGHCHEHVENPQIIAIPIVPRREPSAVGRAIFRSRPAKWFHELPEAVDPGVDGIDVGALRHALDSTPFDQREVGDVRVLRDSRRMKVCQFPIS